MWFDNFSFLHYRGYFVREGKKSSIVVFIFLVLAIVLITIANTKFKDRTEHITELISGRMEEMSVPKALQGRHYQVSNMLKEWRYPFWGHGMGSGGSYARSKGFNGVTDANYFKILFETGLAGLLFFIMLMLMTLIHAIKHYRYYMTEIVIICFVLVSMLGANSLTLFLPLYSTFLVCNRNGME